MENSSTPQESLSVCLKCGPDPKSWTGVRLLADAALRRLGPNFAAEVAAATTETLQERELVSWVLGISGRQSGFHAWPSAEALDLTSHLTHNWIRQWTFMQDLAQALLVLLKGCVQEIQIPNLRWVDAESLFALQALYRRAVLPLPKLSITLDGSDLEETPDERGIVWGTPQAALKRLISSFRGAASCGRLPIRILEPTTPPPTSAPFGDPVASTCVQGHRKGLAEVRLWFQSSGFTSALLTGVSLLDQKPELTPSELAELYHLVGLSAHNRQFSSTADKRVEHFIHDCFLRAFDLETDLARQAALCYRLAVVSGRRLGRLDEAAEWAERGITLAAGLPGLESAYQSAWCRNIRCYLLVRRREARAALADTETSLRLLEPFLRVREARPAESLTAHDWDLLATGHILADYCVSLAAMCEDFPRGLAWIAEARKFLKVFPPVEHRDALNFLDLYRIAGEARVGLTLSEIARHSAARSLDFVRELELTCEAGDFADRLGDHRRAAELFEEARELSKRLGRPTSATALELPLAAVRLRGGQPAMAEILLTAALQGEAGSSADLQSEIFSLLAACAAARGERERAEEWINASIEAALENGRETTLLRSALAAGEVALALEALPTAREAFDRASDLLGDPSAEADGAHSAERVRLVSGLWRSGVRTAAELRPWAETTVRLARRALEDPVSWWLLGPWTAAIRVCRLDRLTEDPASREGLRWIEKAQAEQMQYKAEQSQADH